VKVLTDDSRSDYSVKIEYSLIADFGENWYFVNSKFIVVRNTIWQNKSPSLSRCLSRKVFIVLKLRDNLHSSSCLLLSTLRVLAARLWPRALELEWPPGEPHSESRTI
jgi:hypothetical protein